MTTDTDIRAQIAEVVDHPDLLDEWFEALSESEADILMYESWRDLWARPTQLWPESEWLYWAIMTGRGWGKTRTGAEFIKEGVSARGYRRIALIGRTAPDVRTVMIEGESGILSLYGPSDDLRPEYQPSRRRIVWPTVGGTQAVGLTFVDAEPDQLRGPQHDLAWVDELSAFPNGIKTLDNLKFGLRLGRDPKAIFTFTPRPLSFIRKLIDGPTTHVTRGATWDNAHNLAGGFLEVIEEYQGTATGRQELQGELLEEAEGALWQRQWIDRRRVEYPPMIDGVVASDNLAGAIDPSVTATDNTDEVGIVAAITCECYCQGAPDMHGFVVADRSGQLSPHMWAQASVEMYRDYGLPSLVAEVNQGGDLVPLNIHTVDDDVPIETVRASTGKRTRAEPIANRYEQGRVHHVKRALRYDPERGGLVADPDRDDPEHLAALEDQLCNWEPGGRQPSPGRLDAVVWALTHLMVGSRIRIRSL